MSSFVFPDLTLTNWQETRDTIVKYTRLVGKIRQAMTPPQKHWWHVSLYTTASGLTTSPIAAGDLIFELLLDFTNHQLHISTNKGDRSAIPLTGQSPHQFMTQTLAALAELGLEPDIDQTLFASEQPGQYDQSAVSRFWQAFSQIDAVFKEFRHSFRGESSPVQLWSHNFDLAVVWFSGRLVPDQDPDNPVWADEQMNHGFSTGDGSISEPYFYITAYPLPAGFTAMDLPEEAHWQTEGWTGAVLPYRAIVGTADGKAQLLNFLTTVHLGGKTLMTT